MNEGDGQDCFQQLYKYESSNKPVIAQDMMALFTVYLLKLIKCFPKYFANDDIEKFMRIQDPFHA